MTSLTAFPKLRRTLTDVMEDELYHVPNSPYVHSNGSNTSLGSFRPESLLTIPDLPAAQQQSPQFTFQPLQHSSSPSLSRVSTNDQMIFDNDVPIFSSYADPESVPISEPQYAESEPLVKFNEDLTLSLFDDAEGLMNWSNELRVTHGVERSVNNDQSWGEELEEMLSDSEDEYFDTDWEEDEEVEGPRFGELRRESMSVPSSFNTSTTTQKASLMSPPTIQQRRVHSISNATPTPTEMNNTMNNHIDNLHNMHTMNNITNNDLHNNMNGPASWNDTPTGLKSPYTPTTSAPSSAGAGNQRVDLSSLVPNAQGLHQCQLLNPSTKEQCLKSFSRPYDLIRHQDTIHAQRKKIFRCIVCSGLYPQALYPESHSEDVDMMDVDQGNGQKKEKTFSRGDALSRHVRVKHELSGDEATRAIQWAKDNVEYV